jgi:glutamate racemase
LMRELIAGHAPDIVVVACNTASTVVLPELRRRFTVPFVGTVPAIKPACASSKTRLVSVLGTEATVAREYTKELIRNFADGCEVTLVGSSRLAGLAESALHGDTIDDAAIAAEIAPCFIDIRGRRTDKVVLACTHYPLVLERLQGHAPWPVDWIDPAPAIARRVADLLPPQPQSQPPKPEVVFTSGRAPSPTLAATMARFGLADCTSPTDMATGLNARIDTRADTA